MKGGDLPDEYTPEMEILEMIHDLFEAALRSGTARYSSVRSVSLDGDNDDAELILTLANGEEYVISSTSIRLAGGEDDPAIDAVLNHEVMADPRAYLK